MTQNIFEGAKFGDRFRTRDGRMAIFMSKSPYGFKPYCLIIENRNEETTWYDEKGCSEIGFNTNFDIVSRWEEPIDQSKLCDLADNYCKENYAGCDVKLHPYIRCSYRDGYRAAKNTQ